MYKGFGYILQLLKISPSDLGHHLNVDRTLVSKWKKGSRTINYYSDYFDKLLDYILATNKKLGVNSLEKLFEQVYTGETSQKSLKEQLKTFIVNNETFDLDNRYISMEDEKYSSRFTVYRKVEDRIQCNQLFFDTALNLDKQSKITLIYTDRMDTSKSDHLLLEQWYNNLVSLLKKRFTIDLILSPNKNPMLMYYAAKLMLFDKCMVYLYSDDFNKYGGYSLEIIENRLLIFGLPDPSNNPLLSYYSVYEDSHSIQSFTNLALKIKLDSKLLFNRYKQSDFIQHNNYYDIYIPRSFNLIQPGSVISLSPYPSYLLMSETLFTNVLRNSNYNRKGMERELSIYHKYRPLLLDSYKSIQAVCFIPLDLLNEFANSDTIIYSKQNTLLSPALTLTNEQFRQHLAEVADYLLANKNFSICLYNGDIYPSFKDIHCWTKKNQSLFMFDLKNPTNFAITESSILVNHMFTLLETKYLNTDTNMKSSKHVARILKSI